MATQIEIVTDSTADIPESLIKEHALSIVPAVITIGNTEYHDRIDLTSEQFLQFLQDDTLPHPTTSAASVGEFQTVFENRPDSQIIAVTLGSHFSAMYNNARLAAGEEDPDRISIVDSGTTSLALGFMAIQASLWARQGFSKEAITVKLEEMKKRTNMFASLNTIQYAHKGGRIDHLSFILGSALHLKPILEISENELKSKESRIRTRKESLRRLVDIAHGLSPFEMVGVVHAGCPKDAEEVAGRISEFYDGTIVMGDIGAALAVHAGPDAIGIAAVQKEQDETGPLFSR